MSLLQVLESAKKNKDLNIDVDTVRTGSELVSYISTGSIVLDKLLGSEAVPTAGIGEGRIVEIFGLESSGKTTVSLNIAREVQKRGGNVVFCDFEAALDIGYASRAIGIDKDGERFAWLTPMCLEEGCDLIDYLLDNHKQSKIDLIVIDSVKAMTPKAVIEGLIGDEPPMAIQARLVARWLTKLVKKIKDTRTAVVLLNQLSTNIKTNPYAPGGNYITPGGMAPRFYASQRIELKQIAKENEEKLNPITNIKEAMPSAVKIKASVIKNKIGTPHMSADFYIGYGKGIDNKRSIIDLAVSHGIIQKGGAWYSYREDSGGFKVQGEESLKGLLTDNTNRGLLQEITDKLIFKQDEAVKEAAKELEIEEAQIANKLTKEYSKKKKDKSAEKE